MCGTLVKREKLGKVAVPCLFMVLVLAFTSYSQLRASEVVLTDGAGMIDVPPFVHYLEDKDKALSFEEVRQLPLSEFTRNYQNTLSFGPTPSAFWIRIDLRNDSQVTEWYLSLGRVIYNKILYYLPSIQGDLRSGETGRDYPYYQRDVDDTQFIFKIQLLKGALSTVFLRIESNSSLSFPAKLASEEDMFRDRIFRSRTNFFYYGVIIALLIYNIFLFVVLKGRNYLYYSGALLIFFLLGQMSETGHSFAFFWPSSPKFAQIVHMMFFFSGQALCAAFAQNFLTFHSQKRFWNFLYGILIWSGIGLGLLTPFVQEGSLARFISLHGTVLCLAVIFSSIQSFRDGFKPALFFLIAWGGVCLSGISLILMSEGILPRFGAAHLIFQGTSMLATLLMSIALGMRIRNLESEVLEMKDDSIKKAQELIKFKDHANRLLKRKSEAYIRQLERSVKQVKEEMAFEAKKTIEDMQHAKDIQQASLPSPETLSSYLDNFCVVWRPRELVGGDFYMVKELPDGSVYLALVDCTGHGISGAMFAQTLYSQMLEVFTESSIDRTPADLIRALDSRIEQYGIQNSSRNKISCEIGLCRIDKKKDSLIYAGLGIGLYYHSNGKTSYLPAAKGFVGDWRPRKELYGLANIKLRFSGCSFYMVSDGATDQLGGNKRLPFGRKRLRNLINVCAREKMTKQGAMLENSIDKFRGNEEQNDDISIIGFSA